MLAVELIVRQRVRSLPGSLRRPLRGGPLHDSAQTGTIQDRESVGHLPHRGQVNQAVVAAVALGAEANHTAAFGYHGSDKTACFGEILRRQAPELIVSDQSNQPGILHHCHSHALRTEQLTVGLVESLQQRQRPGSLHRGQIVAGLNNRILAKQLNLLGGLALARPQVARRSLPQNSEQDLVSRVELTVGLLVHRLDHCYHLMGCHNWRTQHCSRAVPSLLVHRLVEPGILVSVRYVQCHLTLIAIPHKSSPQRDTNLRKPAKIRRQLPCPRLPA
mmetsp:Transcript_38448/g.83996  ORF Transcript_38448/g.83996 Transcript_38448/m.83996 type:complete len:275 (-) Transcript_38448:256-1080(-)